VSSFKVSALGKRVPYYLVPTVAAMLFALIYSHRVVIDDAYISFRYLDNWIQGHGLAYNPGERVEGTRIFCG
jgi:hypothetical protein